MRLKLKMTEDQWREIARAVEKAEIKGKYSIIAQPIMNDLVWNVRIMPLEQGKKLNKFLKELFKPLKII